MGEKIRKKNQEAEYNRVSKVLNNMLPLINEANMCALELKREIKFNTRMVKKMRTDKYGGMGKTEILIRVDNAEENYYYEWPREYFENRLFMIKEMLEEFFDTGVIPHVEKQADPFWDPPSPFLIG